jgi:hypothetical protein
MICGMVAVPGSLQARRRKLFALAEHLGLSREERIDIAKTILHRDIISWSNLSPEHTDRLLDALEGAILVQELVRQRGVRHQVEKP